MILFHSTPEPNAPAIRIVRGARWVVWTIKRRHMEPALSWLVWLFFVVAFAAWTLAHYQAPAAPAWIGMTVHTTIFAIWMLVIREWLILRVLRGMSGTGA